MLSRESKMYALKYLKLAIPTKLICHFHNKKKMKSISMSYVFEELHL